MISKYLKYELIFLVGFCLLSLRLNAQTNPAPSFYKNLRDTVIATQDKIIFLDSLAILPSSFQIQELDKTCYTLDFANATLRLSETCTLPDSLHISYRVFPFSLGQKKELNKFVYDSLRVFESYVNNRNDGLKSLEFKSLDYLGAYSRSMNVGNTQSLSLNSNFNMQMSGYLPDSIRIEGAITDNQIPFQPDGNTQRIQEFDRLYLIFERKKHKITLGDYTLEQPKSYFLNFNKRVQGIFYQGKELKLGATKNTVGFSGSIARGQFARNTFNGIEGNQGPYKLTGNNGEQFFILLAGTEKVYIDGFLLERGEDRDYIINYNTGEIMFMPRVLITKDKRIQVEFEYQDRNYLNSLFYAYDELQVNEKLKINLHLYSNQDAKNQPYLQELDDDQKRFLNEVGDDIQNAYYPNAQVNPFEANKVLYRKTDTIVTGINYTDVYVYSTDSTQTLYALSFSFVGEQKGNYIVSDINTNGRSYQWIAPVDGVPQGAYEPVVMLVTPKLHQVVTLGGTYQLDSLKTFTAEGSMSKYDPNLFSTKGNDEHLGFAGKVAYEELRFFGAKDSLLHQKNSIKNLLSFEMVSDNYKVIAPFREVEFARDWNIQATDSIPATEKMLHFQSTLARQNLGNVQYEFDMYERGKKYIAYKNKASLNYIRNQSKAGLILNLMQSQSPEFSSQFWRPTIFMEQAFPKLNQLIIGASYALEQNKIYYINTKNLSPTAFSFDVYNAYIKGGTDDKTTYSLSYKIRADNSPKDSLFQARNRGQNLDVVVNLHQWKEHQLDFTGGWRKLEALDSAYQSTEAPGSSIVGRLNYVGIVKKGFFTPSILYEFGTGQEQKQSFTFVQVPAGQGMYYWIDYNDDGVQQANEFEIGIYPDQKIFVRILSPNNDYVKVNFYKLNASFALNPSQLFEEKQTKGWKGFVSKFSNQFSMELSNRVLAVAGMSAYIPFKTQYEDTQIIGYNQNLINTLFFNRANPKWGAEWMINYSGMKSLLTFGLESSQWMRHTFQARANINKPLSTIVKWKRGFRDYHSGVEDGRTYSYQFNAIQPSITWILGSQVRLTGHYEYDQRINSLIFGGEKAILQSAGLDARFSFKAWGSLQTSATLSMIQFNGDENRGVGIAMLDALKIGNNFLWNLQWNTKISKNIELSIQYDGRKPANTKVIHSANMSVRALL